MDDYQREGEREAERLDRNWSELLQELRVTQTGVQILTGFLLAMPLQQRFTTLDDFTRGVYTAAVVFCVLATCLLIAPVSLHRMIFRRHLKETLVVVGSRLAKTGLVVLGLGVTAVTTLIFGIVFGDHVGQVAGGITVVMFAVIWLVLPLRMMRGSRPD